jgi:protein-S-isoprenylcysteine O-methyltransferase Ste14
MWTCRKYQMPDAVRLAIIVIASTFLPVGGYYRIRSLRGGERLDRTREGWPILIGIRLFGALALASVVALLWKPAAIEWARVPVGETARWAGVAGFSAAVIWLIWMFRSLGRNLTDTVVVRRDAYFVDYGPYSYVRNPMYTGMLAAGLSLGLALGTWVTPLAAGLAFTLLALRTRTEEKHLIDRFGDQYRDYMKRVGRFAPRALRGRRV